MKNEKLVAILLVIVIIVSILIFLTLTYGGNIFNNQTRKKTEEKILALGDCVDVNFIGRIVSNNTIFKSSYINPTNKTGVEPFKIFMSWNESQSPPTGYENYTSDVKGLIEGLVGLKEGDAKTIGPISPEDAYGVYPKVGDIITAPDPTTGKDIKIMIVNITENASMPVDYVGTYGNGTTTLFVLRFDVYNLGDKLTIYPAWENATVVTKINGTKMWTYTTPPNNKIEHFTWTNISNDGYTGVVFPNNTSSVTSINDTTIVVTNNPQIGSTVTELDYYYGNTYYYTVENLTDKNIYLSYVDQSTGNVSYYEFNRTVTIVRNESQDITYTYPTPEMENMLSEIKSYNPNLTFSVNNLAGQSLIYDVQIVKIYKV